MSEHTLPQPNLSETAEGSPCLLIQPVNTEVAWVRSRINSRSNSASDASRLNTNLPCALVVSMGSLKLNRLILRSIRLLNHCEGRQ